MDGASSKPVEGANEMSRFLRAITEAELNQPAPAATLTPQQDPNFAKYTELMAKYDMLSSEMAPDTSGLGVEKSASPEFIQQVNNLKAQADALAGPNAQAWDQARKAGSAPQQTNAKLATNLEETDISKFLSIVNKNDVSILNEGANPHKVSLPVQMAMQHYQTSDFTTVESKPTIRTGIRKYYHDAEQDIQEQQTSKRQLINQYASTIAERVLMREGKQDSIEASAKRAAIKDLMDKDIYADHNKADDFKGTDGKKHNKSKYMSEKQVAENEIPDHSMGFTGGAGPGIQSAVAEAPLDFDKENPSASTIHGHQGVNPATVEARIMRARGQLRDLAAKAESNELLVWESIARHFPELAMNIEQIRHGIEELAKIRKMGGRRTGNIPKDIGEEISIKEANAKKRTLKNSNPCWKGYHPVGTKQQGGRTVPNCVPKE
jgi:hypothetical protein